MTLTIRAWELSAGKEISAFSISLPNRADASGHDSDTTRLAVVSSPILRSNVWNLDTNEKLDPELA